jgi:TolA-binding protein
MIRNSTILGLLAFAAGLMTLTCDARADEPPHLEFVRQLRAQGMPDLALEYLQKLRAKPPRALADRLPIELAEARLDVGRAAVHDQERETLCLRSRQDLNEFLRQGVSPGLAIQVEFELARIDALVAESRVIRAGRQESPAWRRALHAKCRPALQASGNRLAKVRRRAEAVADTSESSGAAAPLSQVPRRAEFDGAVLLFWQMKTYDDGDDLLTRGQLAKNAIDAFEEVATGEKDSLYWEARAWLGRCHLEIDSPPRARQELEAVVQSSGDHAEPGKRRAKYFWLLWLLRNPGARDPALEKQQLAEEWLRTYPAFAGTPEGLAVQFHLANALAGQTQAKSKHPDPNARQILARAEKLYEVVGRSDTDFAAMARERALDLFIAREGDHLSGDPATLSDFRQCFARAQMEIRRMAQDDKQPTTEPAQTKKRVASRQGRYNTIIRSLKRALDLTNQGPPTADVSEARYILTYAYLATGRLREAADFGEQTARTEPRAAQAPATAAYALQAYSQLLSRDERGGGDVPDAAADRARIDRLARYVLRTWPDEPAADVARHELGALSVATKKYEDAISLLSGLAPEYPGYTLAQYLLAGAALGAHEAGITPPRGRLPYLEQAVAALERIPDLSSGADPATAQAFFYAKLQLAKLLFSRRNYEPMARLAENLLTRFGQATLDERTKNELRPAIEALPLYALYGRAAVAYQSGRYAEVRDLLAPLLTQWTAGEPPKTKDPQLLASLLGLGLRASVLESDLKQAQRLLALASHDSLGEQKGNAVLFEVVSDLRGQIEELREKGPDAQAELDKAMAAFGAFLDALAAQPAEKQSPELIRMVAVGYASLDRHRRAAELLERVPVPGAADHDGEALYHGVRVLYARELRLAKEFGKAGQVLTEILAAEWGQRSIDARKEQIFLLEDEGKLAPAIRAWTELMTSVRRQIDQNARLRDQYFDCYYHLVHCRFEHAVKLTDDEKKKAALRRAAGLIVKLETTMPDMGSDALKKRYQTLLRNPALKEQYDELKKASP